WFHSILGCLAQLCSKTGAAIEEPNCFAVPNYKCPNSNISFWLYRYVTLALAMLVFVLTHSYIRSSGQRQGVRITHYNLYDLSINVRNPLKVLIHDFNGNLSSSPSKELLPEFLQIPNLNVLVVDFAKLVPTPCYTQSVHNARLVGRCLGYFLAHLLTARTIHPQQVHLIGFSLGAHVAAFAANYLSHLGLRVPHITALDPAKPLFMTSNLSERLDPSDANFVDVIHTDVFIYGLLQPVGHVDFYPNKGVLQPNCGKIDDIDTHRCYHARAVAYYAESINSPSVFWGFRCKDLYAFVVGECVPSNNVEQLGYFTRESARGSYFLATNESPPYAKGRNFSNLDRSLYGKTFLGDDFISRLEKM
ncbi:hypothetical protein KR093_009730, partial [Drosophila rubida]